MPAANLKDGALFSYKEKSESGSRLLSSDGEIKSRDRFLSDVLITIKYCTRGEMDITAVFGTVIVGSIPTECTTNHSLLTPPFSRYRVQSEEVKIYPKEVKTMGKCHFIHVLKYSFEESKEEELPAFKKFLINNNIETFLNIAPIYEQSQIICYFDINSENVCKAKEWHEEKTKNVHSDHHTGVILTAGKDEIKKFKSFLENDKVIPVMVINEKEEEYHAIFSTMYTLIIRDWCRINQIVREKKEAE